MQITLIIAHQNLGSFNHAIAETIRKTLEKQGHEVRYHDLYQDGFDPILKSGEDKLDEADLDEDIQAYIKEVKESQGLIFVHPNWWGGPPAILRGWVDRVFRQNSTYNFTPNGPVSYIDGKIVQIFSTSNTPRDVELNLYKDPIENFWKVIVFGVFGSKSFERRNFESIIMSTPEQRGEWLAETVETIRRRFS